MCIILCGITIGVTCWLDIRAVFVTCHWGPSVIWHLSSGHVLTSRQLGRVTLTQMCRALPNWVVFLCGWQWPGDHISHWWSQQGRTTGPQCTDSEWERWGILFSPPQITQFVSVWLLLWIEITHKRMGRDGDWFLLLGVVDPGSDSTVPPVFCNNSTPWRGSSALLFDRGIQLGIGCQWAAKVSHYCTQKWDNCKSVSAQSPNVNVKCLTG